MLIKNRLSLLLMNIFLTFLLLIGVGFATSFSAEIFCLDKLSETNPAKLKFNIEPGFNADDLNLVIFRSLLDGKKEIGRLEARFTEKNQIHIAKIQVDEAYRKNGISESLLKSLIDKTGKKAIYSTYLEGTNREAFVETYKKLTDETSPNYNPTLTNSERELAALKQTPAYKIRNKLGLGKITKYEIQNCQEKNCPSPEIHLWVTAQ